MKWFLDGVGLGKQRQFLIEFPMEIFANCDEKVSFVTKIVTETAPLKNQWSKLVFHGPVRNYDGKFSTDIIVRKKHVRQNLQQTEGQLEISLTGIVTDEEVL